jgi:hypothetical protein
VKKTTTGVKAKKRDHLNIHCSTINCGGQLPESVHELLPIFYSIEFDPDIYVVSM